MSDWPETSFKIAMKLITGVWRTVKKWIRNFNNRTESSKVWNRSHRAEGYFLFLKKIICGCNNRLDQAEQKISKPEDKSLEIIQLRAKRKKEEKEKEFKGLIEHYRVDQYMQ